VGTLKVFTDSAPAHPTGGGGAGGRDEREEQTSQREEGSGGGGRGVLKNKNTYIIQKLGVCVGRGYVGRVQLQWCSRVLFITAARRSC
jgi:hypothetical protein